MMPRITRSAEGYEATLGDWAPAAPLTRDALEQKLRELGVHWRDVSELLRSADHTWLLAHPDEPDPDEFVSITRSERGYSAMTDRREGFSTERSESREGLIDAIVARGFDRSHVERLMDATDEAWDRDIATNRSALGSVDVALMAGGYRIRTIGTANWAGVPMSRAVMEQFLRKTFYMDPALVEALLQRADRDAATGDG